MDIKHCGAGATVKIFLSDQIRKLSAPPRTPLEDSRKATAIQVQKEKDRFTGQSILQNSTERIHIFPYATAGIDHASIFRRGGGGVRGLR
jgi:hypothetical protein